MKQTNNALKYLLAQYRAIFKHAYFKGLVSAAVLTAGLVAGQAQAYEYYYWDPATNSGEWLHWDDERDAIAFTISGGIVSAVVAGDNLKGSLTEEQAKTSASNGTLNIGGPNADLTYVSSGNAAAGWAQASGAGVTVSANNNTLNITGTGYVEQSGVSGKGVAYGGYARSDSGAAIATGNTVNIERDENLIKVAAVSVGIIGGKAQGLTGATASNNTVNITGNSTTRQVVNSVSGNGIFVGYAVASGNSATGTYSATGNEAYLNHISIAASGNSNDLNLLGSYVDLSGSSAKGEAGNSLIQLQDGYITTNSGGAILANYIRNGSGDAIIQGNGRGLDISDSFIQNDAAGATYLTVAGSRINLNSSGNATIENSVVSLSSTAISGAKVGVVGAEINNSGASANASKNVVRITEDNSNRDEDTGTYERSINADVRGVTLVNSYTTDNTLEITASNNVVEIGTDTNVSGTVIGVAIQASGSKIASLAAVGNTVTVAGKVTGSIKAVEFNTNDDAASGQVSFLKNTVTLQNGADVSSGDLTGGMGTESAVNLDDGSLYTVSEANKKIVSDTANLNGTINITKDGTLTISGFYENGLSTDTTFNPGQANVGASANIFNAGTLTIVGTTTVDNGANIVALQEGAEIVVDGAKVKNDLSLDDGDFDDKAGDGKYTGSFQYVNKNHGTLEISTADAMAYLTASKENVTGTELLPDGTYTDYAGKIKLTSGGTLHFTDTGYVELGKQVNESGDSIGFVFGSGNGQINIDSSSTAPTGSTFKGIVSAANVRVSEALDVATGYTLGDTLIKANDSLVIGDGIADDSHALTKLSDFIGTDNTVSFMSMGDVTFDADVDEDTNNNGDTFTIDSNLYLQNDDPNVTAQITGDRNLIVDLDSTENFYIAGKYQTSSNITLQSGTISVGLVTDDKYVSGITADGNNNLFEGVTNVALNGSLINGATSTTDVTILVQGHGAGEVTPATDPRTFYDHRATLDLTGASLQTASGAQANLILKASGSGTLRMNASQVISIIAGNTGDAEPNTQQFGIVLTGATANTDEGVINAYPDNGKAILDITGTGALNAEFDDFQAAGTGTANKIQLDGNSLILADSAALTNRDNSGTTELDLQGAELRVDSLAVSDNTLDRNDVLVETATITNGTYTVADSLSSTNTSITVGDAATVNLGDDTTTSGSVTTNLVLDGTDAEVNVRHGAWTAQNVTIADGTMTIAGNQVFDPDNDMFVPASFTGKALTMEDGSLNVGSNTGKAIVGSYNYPVAAQATFTTAALDKGSIVNVYNYSTLTLEGDAAASGAAGIDYADDVLNVTGGELIFGEAATAAMYTQNGDALTVADGFGQIALSENGTVKLTFAEGTSETFTATEAVSLKEQLFGVKNGTLLDGVLNVGNAGLAIEGLGTGTVTWENFKPFADMASDVTNNDLLSTTVTNVNGTDGFRGHVGAINTVANLTSVSIKGDTSLESAATNAANPGHFATDPSGNDVTLNVGAGYTLELVNGGTAGAVTLAQDSELFIDGNEAETIINGDVTGLEGDLSATNGAVTVNGNVQVDELELVYWHWVVNCDNSP